MLQVEALPKPSVPNSSSFEVTVASSVLRVLGETAYLSLLQVVNERASLRVLLEAAGEALLPQGIRSLIGPVGASPYLEQGALASHWHLLPPQLAPYNPPYLPELCSGLMQPAGERYLYELELPSHASQPHLPTFDPERLADELLPLLRVASETSPDLPPLSVDEARLILRLLKPFPLTAYLAEQGGAPAGFVLLQPDLAPLLRATWGTRGLVGRLRFGRLRHRPVTHGRIIFLGVLPVARRQGLGSKLLEQAVAHARAQGWQSLSLGPLRNNPFLLAHGARETRRYELYRYSL